MLIQILSIKNTKYTTYTVKDDHEGIVSRELWEKVQTRIDEADADQANGIYRNGIETHCLYGIVYCAQCGSPMVRRTYLNRKKESGKGWYCRGRQYQSRDSRDRSAGGTGAGDGRHSC